MSDYLADRGIVYVAINTTSDTNAAVSARSAKHHIPGIHITLFTDQDTKEGVFNNIVKIPSRSDIPVFKDSAQYPDQGYIAKAWYMGESPYRSTIYLDMDTFVLDDLSDVFDALDHNAYDVAAVMDEAYTMVHYHYPDMPACLPRYNGGVIAWKWNRRTERMFSLFREYLVDNGGLWSGCDEVPFARAIHKSMVRMLTLAPEYNCRFIYPYILRYKARILHGRPDEGNYDTISEQVNNGVAEPGLGSYRVMYKGRKIATLEPIVGFQD